MRTPQDQIDELVIRLRERGLRLTPQRMAVLRTLIGCNEHLSAEDIHKRVRTDYPMTGLATVYKTVAVLKDMGEITELNFNNDCARYDGSGDTPHPHFICTKCNTIIDLDKDILGKLPEKIAQDSGYKIINTRLDFFGICKNCQSGKNSIHHLKQTRRNHVKQKTRISN